MRISHIAMLAAALVCATVAALLSRAWLISQSAQAPAATETTAIPSRSVVVAARDIKYGDKLNGEAIKLVSWPGDAVPSGTFRSKEALLGAQETRTALQAMAKGEPILEYKLLGGTSTKALSAKLNENMKAVTIRVNDVAGVAGFVQPDDRVDVFLTYAKQTGPENAAITESSVVVLLQNIRVLAVDQVTERKEQAAPAKAVTLEASTEEAQKLILAGRVGEMSLGLNRIAAERDPGVTGTVAFEDLLQAEDKTRRRSGGPVVTVTRQVERKSYQVESDNGRRDEGWQHEILSHQNGRRVPAQ
jgi:pilus assembly protein CpaB